MKKKIAEELHYIDDNGKRQDMVIHEPILRAGDDDAAAAVSEAVMRREGFSDEQITTLLGKNPKRKMKSVRRGWRGSRSQFMQQCISVITDESGGDDEDARQVCEQLWEDGVELDELE